MVDVIYQKDKAFQTAVIFPSSFLLVYRFKKSGKELRLTSRQHIIGCSSEKTREDHSCSGLTTASLPIAQHTLAQKPVPGTGAEFQELRLLHKIYCTSDTLRESMWMTFLSLPKIDVIYTVCPGNYSPACYRSTIPL